MFQDTESEWLYADSPVAFVFELCSQFTTAHELLMDLCVVELHWLFVQNFGLFQHEIAVDSSYVTMNTLHASYNKSLSVAKHGAFDRPATRSIAPL